MRINARLDEATSRKLGHLKRMTGWSISEIVRRAVDAYHVRLSRVHARSRRSLTESGFIGCSQGPVDLSETYKDELMVKRSVKAS